MVPQYSIVRWHRECRNLLSACTENSLQVQPEPPGLSSRSVFQTPTPWKINIAPETHWVVEEHRIVQSGPIVFAWFRSQIPGVPVKSTPESCFGALKSLSALVKSLAKSCECSSTTPSRCLRRELQVSAWPGLRWRQDGERRCRRRLHRRRVGRVDVSVGSLERSPGLSRGKIPIMFIFILLRKEKCHIERLDHPSPPLPT